MIGRNRPVARRFTLDAGPPIDPFGLAGPTGRIVIHAGRVLVGLGTALDLPVVGGLDSPEGLDEVTRALAEVEMDDHSSSPHNGLLAFGTFPFDRSADALVSVAAITYGRDGDGTEWLTVVADERDDLPGSVDGLRASLLQRVVGPTEPSTPGSTRPRILPLLSDQAFRTMVVDALDAIEDGTVDKVVLARQVEVDMGRPIDIVELLRRWSELEPTCTVFALPTPEGQFLGASPELLVERLGHIVQSRPLAGTTDLSGSGSGSGPGRGNIPDPSPSENEDDLPRELLRSEKDGREHRLVVDAIAQALDPYCEELELPSGPDLVHLHNITHLGTSLTGTLRADEHGVVPSVLHLVGALHPTPAVGGVPSRSARDLIATLEPVSRGHYAGPVGYVDAVGDGRWMVGIRSVSVAGDTARMAAGVGIVRGSRPDTELRETDLKLTAVFDALAPGVPFSTADEQSRHQAVS